MENLADTRVKAQIYLMAVVPLKQASVATMNWAMVEPTLWSLGEAVSYNGSDVMYDAPPDRKALAVDDLSDAVTVLSFLPGGVDIFGLHFEARHPDITYPAPGVAKARQLRLFDDKEDK